MPDNLTLDKDTGIISGQATKAGDFKFKIKVTDKNGSQTDKDFTIKVNPKVTIKTGSLENTTIDVLEYSQSISVEGGERPYIFEKASGDLPDNLTLDKDNGTISGQATKTGDYKFKIKVTDKYGSEEYADFIIKVGSGISGPYGSQDDGNLSSSDEKTYELEKNNYSIYTYGGGVIDSLGFSCSDKTGGAPAGGPDDECKTPEKGEIFSIKDVEKVDITWGRYARLNVIRITSLKFYDKNNILVGVKKFGSGSTDGGGKDSFSVPNGEHIVGIKVNAAGLATEKNKYLGRIWFITNR